ncbi:MAG TPA: phosphotransferase [Gaiellaceae bacterium]|jgi:trehalose synthase-fused probable maltokinase|nr:phosphotransferase [Gaiellaceae bacterium]
MSTFDERALIDYVTRQRWYGAKSRAVSHSEVVDAIDVRTTDPPLAVALVELRYETGAHDIYQLLVSTRDGGIRFDGLAENAAFARELVSAMRTSLTLQGEQGIVEFSAADDFSPLSRELGSARLIGSEQSNSSVVFEDALILKLFRRLEPGINPELELLRFLGERGFRNIPALGGWYSYSGGPLAATLGLLQEYVADGRDGWELALEEIASAPERLLDRLARLGEVTGQMHTALGSDPNDPAFAPEEPSVESLGLLTATVDEEIARVFLSLPDDDERLAPILGRGEEVREQLRLLTYAASAGRVIRTHGDYHLGQTLWAGTDWVVLDFEGEPARTLVERRRKRSPLRDVAGMLRSFAYAATAAGLEGGADGTEEWEERARERFLEGYLETADPTLLPSGQPAIERLLAVFELEKAVYELRYELDNRPDWVRIPVTGIERLMRQAAEAT